MTRSSVCFRATQCQRSVSFLLTQLMADLCPPKLPLFTGKNDINWLAIEGPFSRKQWPHLRRLKIIVLAWGYQAGNHEIDQGSLTLYLKRAVCSHYDRLLAFRTSDANGFSRYRTVYVHPRCCHGRVTTLARMCRMPDTIVKATAAHYQPPTSRIYPSTSMDVRYS